jgi:choice-of-anchor C domain-containing protein
VTRGQIDYIGSYWQHADGKRSLDLHGSPGFGGVKQTFATEKGKKYRVSFSLAGNVDGQVKEKKLGVKAAGKEEKFTFDCTGKSRTDMGWSTQVWDFTATDKETTLELYTLMDDDPNCGPALDNVSVVAVDE